MGRVLKNKTLTQWVTKQQLVDVLIGFLKLILLLAIVERHILGKDLPMCTNKYGVTYTCIHSTEEITHIVLICFVCRETYLLQNAGL